MDKNIPIILVGLVVTAILFWIVAFGVGAFSDNENDDDGKNYFGDKSEFGSHRMKEGYVLGCYGEEIPQIRGEGKEHKIVNLNKRCYKEVFSGCRIKYEEVSCFPEIKQIRGEGRENKIEQVRGEGNCFNLNVKRDSCAVKYSKGCFSKTGEVSCMHEVKRTLK